MENGFAGAAPGGERMLTALVIAAVLALGGGAGLMLLSRSPGDTPAPADLRDAAEPPPALVSLVLHGCAPGLQAYEATIIDLAARGFLSVSAGPAGWQVRLPAPAQAGAGDTALAGHEQRVLRDVTVRLRGTGSAPFAALADACRADVRGTWDPFEAALRSDARRSGLSRPALPVRPGTIALAGATTVAIAAGAYLAAGLVAEPPGSHAGTSGPVLASVIAVLVLWGILGWLARQDRLTPFGSALASQLRRDPFFTASLAGRGWRALLGRT